MSSINITKKNVTDMGSGLIHSGYDYAGRYQTYGKAVETAINLHDKQFPNAEFVIATMPEYSGYSLYFKGRNK